MKKIFLILLILIPLINLFSHTKDPETLIKELERSTGDDYIEVLNQLAYEYIAYDNEKSIAYSEVAINLNQKDDPQKLISLLIYGINEIYLGYTERGDSLTKAEELFNHKFKDNIELEGYYNYFMGHVSFGLHSYTRSLDYFHKANIIFNDLNNSIMANISLSSASSLYLTLGKIKSGLDNLEVPYNYFKSNGYIKYQILIMTSIGLLKYYLGEVEEAEEIYLEALSLSKSRYPWMIPKVRNMVANYYVTSGNMEKALELYYKGLSNSDSIPDIELGYTHSNIAYILISREEYSKAFDHLQSILELGLENKYLKDFSNNNLGNIYRLKKEFELSEYYLLAVKESISDELYSWTTRDNYYFLANLYKDQGDFKRAYDIANEHLEIYFNYAQSQEYRDLINREEEISFEIKSMEIEAVRDLQTLKIVTLVIVVILLTALVFVIFIYFLKARRDKLVFEKLSQRDFLTNLFNRRTFIEKGMEEVERIGRYQSTFSIVIMDIDNFKSFNDDYNHQCGDEVIKGVAKLLLEECRYIDTLARWGGEEFILLLPETPVEGAISIAERLREKIEKSSIFYGNFELQLTITMGVEEYKKGLSLDDVINRADLALILGKKQGKNRVLRYE